MGLSRFRLRVVALVILCGLVRPDAAAASSQEVRAARSDTIVKLAGQPRHPRGGELIVEASFGAADGPPEHLLASVLDVLPARDGTTWILDGTSFVRGPFSLRQFDANGSFIRAVGRMGQGPGEFSRPTSLGQLPDGRVVLWQAPRSSLTFYSESGVAEKTTTYPTLAGTAVSVPRTLHVDPRGQLGIEIYRGGSLGRAVARISPEGELLDIVPSPEGMPTAQPSTVALGGGVRGSMLIPYGARAIWSWSPLGYWVTGISTRFAFEIRLPVDARSSALRAPGASPAAGVPRLWRPGDPIVSVRWTADPIEISAAERRDQAAYLLAQLRAMNATAVGDTPEIPTRKPAYRRLVLAADGRIWVEISVASQRLPAQGREGIPGASLPLIQWREPSVWRVFEPDGALIGRIELPWQTEPYVMKGDYMWAKATDDSGIEIVKRFRIQWR